MNNLNKQIIAVVGEKGGDPVIESLDFETFSARIGGRPQRLRIDAQTAVFYNAERQTATPHDPQTLVGTIVLCGINGNGSPVSLSTVRQVVKHLKLFKKSRTVQPPDPTQLSLFEADGEEVTGEEDRG